MPNSADSWPPTCLRNYEAIVAHCQDLHVGGAATSSSHEIHMAALLYSQNWNGARHLHSSTNRDPLLEPYFRVAAAALQQDMAATWKAVSDLTSCPYQAEIAHALRVSCLRRWAVSASPPPEYYAQVLGFRSVEELGQFYQQLATTKSEESTRRTSMPPSLTQVVSFLESRTVVDQPAN